MAIGREQTPLWIRMALLAGGAVAGLALAEVGARLAYDRPWHERLLAEQVVDRRLDYRLNGLGLRDAEFAVPRPPGERRVLMLGDSITFGFGVPDDEAVFPALVERRLNESPPLSGGERFDVLNAGIPGSVTGHWVRLWRRIGRHYDPELVVLVFFLRDGTSTASIPAFFGRIRDEITLRNRRSPPYRHLFVYRLYRDWRDRQAIGEQYRREFDRAYFGDQAAAGEWRAAQLNLTFLRDDVRRQGGEVAFVVFPILVELNDDYPFRRICDHLESWAVAQGFPVLNLLPAYLGEEAPALWVSALDQHPNERGHAIAAGALTPFIRSLLAEPAAGAGSVAAPQPSPEPR
jgi:lysophospholipase L1-like esterase